MYGILPADKFLTALFPVRILSSVAERLHDTQEAGGPIPPGCTDGFCVGVSKRSQVQSLQDAQKYGLSL